MIASLRIQNFRSFDDASFEFEQGVNIIVGPNASGKTNLLESILVVARGGSYRGVDAELIKKGKPWAKISAVTTGNTKHTVKMKQDGDKAQKTFIIEQTEYKRLVPHHKMPCVIFEPNQLQYIATSPELRRSLIDNLNEEISDGFLTKRRAYQRALAQRNALLKTPGSKNKLFAWDIRLSELAGNIVADRLALIEKINKSIEATYNELAGSKHKVSISYESKTSIDNYAGNMLSQLETFVDRDIERGFTGFGPHRDDIDIKINNASIKSFASRGEIRTVLLAIKVQEALLLEEKFNQKALMLLDDVFGELDGRRRKALTSFLQSHQAFITTTDADIINHEFTSPAKLIAL